MRVNTKPYEKDIKAVYIDDREQDRIEYAFDAYSSLNPVRCHLDVGDYIFESPDGKHVAFEFKTGADFLNSINGESHHLHNQVYELVTNFDHRFVIVQCEDMRKELNALYYQTGIDMSFAQLNGAIADFNRVCTVVSVQTLYQAFDYMVRQAGKIFRDNEYKWTYGKKTTNSALNYLSAIKGLDKRAEQICKTLDLKTLEDLLNLEIEDLTEVKGVGSKKAEMIIRNLRSDLHGQQTKNKLSNEKIQ